MKRTRIASIDAGASKVVTVMADLNGNGDLRILGVGVAASQRTERGMITNPRQAAAAISQSVRKAEKMAGYRLKSACVGISGTDTNSVTNRGIISIPHSDQQVHAADRSRGSVEIEPVTSERLCCGIAMLHIELAALHCGISGNWTYFGPPLVAKFEVG